MTPLVYPTSSGSEELARFVLRITKEEFVGNLLIMFDQFDSICGMVWNAYEVILGLPSHDRH